jgi:hypothetical protein
MPPTSVDVGVIRVEEVALGAGALLHAQLGAERGEFLGGFGNEGNPAFAG